MRISGSSAVVVGGAGGLGEATVRRLHAAGAQVVVADLADDKGKALEEELGRLAPGPEQVAEARKGDRARVLALLDHEALGLRVRRCAEGEPVADADEPLLALEEGCERGVVHGDGCELRCGELGLGLLGRSRALAKARHRAREVEARASPLDALAR